MAESLQRLSGADTHLIGTRTGLEERLFRDSGLPYHLLVARPLPARRGLRWLWAAGCIAAALAQAVVLLRRLRPDAVAGTGGYASVCVVRAARLLGIPHLIHEMDAHPGRANRLLARHATRVTAGFGEALSGLGRPDGLVTGNPIRAEFRSPDAARARERHHLSPARPLVMAWGGSRGAVALNSAVLAAAEDVVAAGADLLLVTGRGNMGASAEAAQALPDAVRPHVHLLEYVDTGMADLMSAADIGVSRAGGATCFELAAAGLPAILVPYPYAMGGHQQRNAEAYAETGAAIVLGQDEAVRPGRLGGLLGELLKENHRRRAMAESALRHARPDAADAIAQCILDLVVGGRH